MAQTLDRKYDPSEGDSDAYADPTSSSDQDDDESEYGFEDPINVINDYEGGPNSHGLPRGSYKVLSEQDVRRRQDKASSSISNCLSISPADAKILLLHFKWSVDKVNEAWFADEEGVRASAGLLQIEASPPARRTSRANEGVTTCKICFESHAAEEMRAPPACGHIYCGTCWTGYVHSAIDDGPGCLTLRCAHPSCRAAIRADMVLALASAEDQSKYERFLLWSYVEENKRVKWCPAPGCEFAVEWIAASAASTYDVVCKCGYNFCWNCQEDAHRPVRCDTVHKWVTKHGSKAENANWLLANSKPCPKCQRPIEKNHGCMHMTCMAPCGFEFCWLCLQPWSEHTARDGGFYTCNRYEKAKQEGLYTEEKRRRSAVRHELRRYSHYHERWATNENSRAKARSALQLMQRLHVDTLSDRYSLPLSQLAFLESAWLQVAE